MDITVTHNDGIDQTKLTFDQNGINSKRGSHGDTLTSKGPHWQGGLSYLKENIRETNQCPKHLLDNCN